MSPIVFVIALGLALFGGKEKPVTTVLEGSRDLPETRGRVTAREALALVNPAVLETSAQPVLLIITSGTDITGEGRSGTWEFVFHFPSRSAQGVYSLEPVDPDAPASALRMKFRLSPRRDAKGADHGLPPDFIDSPDAVRELGRAGVDWTAGDPDLTLSTKRLPSGDVVWAVESYGKEYTAAFQVRDH